MSTMAEHADRDAFEWLRKYALGTGNPYAAHALTLWHDAVEELKASHRDAEDLCRQRNVLRSFVQEQHGHAKVLDLLCMPSPSEMQDIPPEAAQVLRDNFWKLV